MAWPGGAWFKVRFGMVRCGVVWQGMDRGSNMFEKEKFWSQVIQNTYIPSPDRVQLTFRKLDIPVKPKIPPSERLTAFIQRTIEVEAERYFRLMGTDDEIDMEVLARDLARIFLARGRKLGMESTEVSKILSKLNAWKPKYLVGLPKCPQYVYALLFGEADRLLQLKLKKEKKR